LSTVTPKAISLGSYLLTPEKFYEWDNFLEVEEYTYKELGFPYSWIGDFYLKDSMLMENPQNKWKIRRQAAETNINLSYRKKPIYSIQLKRRGALSKCLPF